MAEGCEGLARALARAMYTALRIMVQPPPLRERRRLHPLTLLHAQPHADGLGPAAEQDLDARCGSIRLVEGVEEGVGGSDMGGVRLLEGFGFPALSRRGSISAQRTGASKTALCATKTRRR